MALVVDAAGDLVLWYLGRTILEFVRSGVRAQQELVRDEPRAKLTT